MKVLVVGGAGYIGSHSALAVREAGHTPVIYDNLSRGNRRLVGPFAFIEGDLGDQHRLKVALEKIDAVMHFAGLAYVDESMRDPRRYWLNNVGHSLTLVDAMMDMGVKHLVFSSSCAVYGIPASRGPITEETPRIPVSSYGATKATIEEILFSYARAYGLTFFALRYFNAAGADARGRAGEMHNPETHVIPSMLRVAAGLADHFTVYGLDYGTRDGSCIRDFVHVSDIANAHVKALEALRAAPISEAINLGSGRGYSILEVLHCVEKVTGRRVALQVSPRRQGDPPELVSSADRAQRRLNWSAQRTLEEMVRDAWNFQVGELHDIGLNSSS